MSAAVDVAALDDLADGEASLVTIDEVGVALVRQGDEVFAIHDTCSHALESLSGGWVEDGRIECPRHGAAFRLTDGEALTPPATRGVPVFPVEVRDGRVLVTPTPSCPHPILDR